MLYIYIYIRSYVCYSYNPNYSYIPLINHSCWTSVYQLIRGSSAVREGAAF
jgi:hypothetical protein